MNTQRRIWSLNARSFALTALCIACAAGAAFAQSARISMPRMPGAGSSQKQSEIKPSKRDTPEVASVTPDLIMPVKTLEVTVAGHKLYDGMALKLQCRDVQGDRELSGQEHFFILEAAGVKAQGEAKAVATFNMPPNHPEVKCQLAVPQLGFTQYNIVMSPHANDPKPIGALFVAEGNLAPMDLMMKAGMAGTRYGKDQFVLGPDFIKYVQEGKQLFQQPISNIKSVEKIALMPGQNPNDSALFKITTKDGKTYTFMSTESGSDHDAYKVLLKKVQK